MCAQCDFKCIQFYKQDGSVLKQDNFVGEQSKSAQK